MKLYPDRIAPSQGFLKPKTVKFIFDCLSSGKLNDLPPLPIVRRDGDGQLVAIDGHNLLAVYSYFGKTVEVHLAKTADDGLPETSAANRTRNQELRQKFDESLVERDCTKAAGITSFDNLIAKYPNLFESKHK